MRDILMCLWVAIAALNRLAMPTVNDSRAFTFTEIINERRCISRKVYKSRAGVAGNTSAPPKAVTRPRWSITIWLASWRISEASWLT